MAVRGLFKDNRMTRENFESGEHFRSIKHGKESKVFYKSGCSIWAYWPNEPEIKRIECSCFEFNENGFQADTYVFHRPVEDFYNYQDFELVRSEEHTSELQSLMRISSAVLCLKTTKNTTKLVISHN